MGPVEQTQFAAIFHSSPVGLSITRQRDSVFLEVNNSFSGILGYSRDELLGKTAREIGIWHDLSEMERLTRKLKSEGKIREAMIVSRSRSGALRYLESSVEPTVFDGEPCYLTTLIDRTESKRIQVDLENAVDEARQFREALDKVPSYVFIKNAKLQYTYANTMTLKFMGVNLKELIGKADNDLYPHEIAVRLQDIDDRVLNGETTANEVTITDQAKRQHIFWAVKTPLQNSREEIVGLVGIATDITEHKALERRLHLQATTDHLTGLPNRGAFFRFAHHAMSRARRYGEPLAIGMLDLDKFKNINDAHGHETGDRVLKAVADVFQKTLRESDFAGRIGGEEFAVLWPMTTAEQALRVADRLRIAIENAALPLPTGLTVRFTASVGVASLDAIDKDVDAFLGRADQALYNAKHAGRNRVQLA